MKEISLTIATVRDTGNTLPSETEHTNILLPVGNKYPCAWLNEGTDKEEFIILIDGTFHTAQSIDFEFEDEDTKEKVHFKSQPYGY